MAAGRRESEPVSRTLAGPADGPDVVVNLIRRWFTATFIPGGDDDYPRGTTTPTPGGAPDGKTAIVSGARERARAPVGRCAGVLYERRAGPSPGAPLFCVPAARRGGVAWATGTSGLAPLPIRVCGCRGYSLPGFVAGYPR